MHRRQLMIQLQFDEDKKQTNEIPKVKAAGEIDGKFTFNLANELKEKYQEKFITLANDKNS